MKAFVLGSCRVWNPCIESGLVTKSGIIQAHYPFEIIQYIKWLTDPDSDDLDNNQRECFRHEFKNSNGVDLEWAKFRSEWAESDIIIVEVSSLKYVRDDSSGLYYNLISSCDIPSRSSTEKEIVNEIIKIHDIIKSDGKKVVFLSHVNSYSPRNMGFIKSRIIIQDAFKKAIRKIKSKVNFIDPSNLLSIHGKKKCLLPKKVDKINEDVYDFNHYTPFFCSLMARRIKKMVNL